jgi:hypothetical protein
MSPEQRSVAALRALWAAAADKPGETDYALLQEVDGAYVGRSRGGLPALVIPLSEVAPTTVGRRASGCEIVGHPSTRFVFGGHDTVGPAAALLCTEPNLVDAFAVLALDVASRARDGGGTWSSVLAAVEEWQTLLTPRQLPSAEAEEGLWGELWFLSQAEDVDRALAGWRGPEGDATDFFVSGKSAEVKTSRQRRQHHVSQSQVSTPAGTYEAWVLSIWVKLDPGTSNTVAQLADEILERSERPWRCTPPAPARRVLAAEQSRLCRDVRRARRARMVQRRRRSSRARRGPRRFALALSRCPRRSSSSRRGAQRFPLAALPRSRIRRRITVRLADLLADTALEELERIAHEHAKTEDHLSRPQLLLTIEGVLRSYRFLQDFLIDRQPPTFAIMTLLLDAPEFTLPTSEFRSLVLAETARICRAIDANEVLKRDDQLRVYRRVLYQARSNDMQIDASEAALLAVLRQELNVAHVEHFLIEHHADLREFWREDSAYMRELQALRSAGLVFVNERNTILPEDLGVVVRQVLGVDMSRSAARRLFEHLPGHDLHDALQAVGAPSSGTKDERIDRLIAHMAQPRVVLRGVDLDTLRAICRDTGAAVSGAKDDLIERIVGYMSAGRDLIREPEPPPPAAEPRRLSEARFNELFEHLRGHELAGILGEFDLRRSGTKETQVRALWDAQRAETTLLACLTGPELDGLLRRVGLKAGGGSKPDRIDRLLGHLASLDGVAAPEAHSAAPAPQSEEEISG